MLLRSSEILKLSGKGDRNWLACVGKSDPHGDATRHAGWSLVGSCIPSFFPIIVNHFISTTRENTNENCRALTKIPNFGLHGSNIIRLVLISTSAIATRRYVTIIDQEIGTRRDKWREKTVSFFPSRVYALVYPQGAHTISLCSRWLF